MAGAAALELSPAYGETEALTQLSSMLLHSQMPEGIDPYGELHTVWQSTGEVRAPEAEIYGRSLGTIYKLGALMVENSVTDVVHSPEAEQARVEFYTSVEEGFGTDMELGGGLEVRDFDARPLIGGRVMAKDLKTAVSDMTEAGLSCAEHKVRAETAIGDYRFVPQLIRSEHDHRNALLVDAMARGETAYNTRIVASPFPEEGAAASGEDYWRNIGYVPSLRRGFIQLYHATEDGEVITGSLSFDGSDKNKLRQLFADYNVEIPEDETTDNWLQYAVTATLTTEQAKAVALRIADQAGDPRYKKTTNTVAVTGAHRTIMDMAFDDSYVHACESHARGYQTPGVRRLILQLADKAGSFNERYARALYDMRANQQRFTDDDMIVVHELLVYSTIEMMRALHTGSLSQTQDVSEGYGTQATVQPDAAYLQALDREAFQSRLAGFGADGAKNNRVYSACGLSISPGEGNREGTAENPQSAFGGNTTSGDFAPGDEDKYGSLEFDCPKCKRTNRRPRGKLIPNCQKCGADVTCK